MEETREKKIQRMEDRIAMLRSINRNRTEAIGHIKRRIRKSEEEISQLSKRLEGMRIMAHSSGVERAADIREVAGSNPAGPMSPE